MSVAFRVERVAYETVAALRDALDCPEPLAWVLARRGLHTAETAREFLAADGPLDPPESIPGIAEAADRLALALARGERVVVHGDYDCDGICSTAILVESLRARGGDVDAFLPSRFTDGYGVSVANVEGIAEAGGRLLVCVDCGTTDVAALTRARELGLEAIVCDHHLAGGHRPPAILANPALGRGAEVLPAAAGVVLKLTQALAARVDRGGLAPPAESALDLAALATVADAVPLLGENRRLVARGLTALRDAPRPGLAALCRAAGASARGATARTLGFTLAPAINAAGRLAHPERALALLLGAPGPALDALAADLWGMNEERRRIERDITDQAVARIEGDERAGAAAALVVSGAGWHEGVVGIVASRLVERFGRPAVVLSELEGGVAKGSGRSLPGVDLHALVSQAAGRLTRWGGHQGAVGLQLPVGEVPGFARELAAAAERARAAIERARVRDVDAVVSVRDLGLATAEALEALAPFGRGNPEIALLVPGCEVEEMGRVGNGHRVFRLLGSGAHARAVAFAGRSRPEVAAGARHDAVVRLGVSRWQDTVGPEVVVEALAPVGAPRRLRGACAAACDLACPARAPLARVRAAVARESELPAPPPPASVRVADHRGAGAVVPLTAALAASPGGVVLVVADVALRRPVLVDALEPGRLGLEAVLLAGSRCAGDAVMLRAAEARGGPQLVLVEYEALPGTPLPAGAPLVLVDPPAEEAQWAWARARAGAGGLHLAWGAEEAALAELALRDRLDLRPIAAALWPAFDARAEHLWDDDLARLLLGDGRAIRHPGAVGRALAALAEAGHLTIDERGVRVVAGGGPLADAPRAVACAARLAAGLATIAAFGTDGSQPIPEGATVARGIVSV